MDVVQQVLTARSDDELIRNIAFEERSLLMRGVPALFEALDQLRAESHPVGVMILL